MTQPVSLKRVLVVDDDRDLREAHLQALSLAGLEAEGAVSADIALLGLDATFAGVIVSDIRMPGMDGLTFAARVRDMDEDLPVILMTGHGDIDMAVQALQRGVFDFLAKPFGVDRLLIAVRRALKQRALVLENRRLQALVVEAASDGTETGLIGQSAAIVKIRQTLAQVAAADVDVLIEGESGVGKELAARSLHRLGPRRRRPFVMVNCAALPEATFDVELFGRPASTQGRRIGGRVREASGGTLLFDEIDALGPGLQAKLMALLEQGALPQEGEVAEYVDLRVMATSKIDLAEASRAGQFRPDLYYRLGVVSLRLPPLKEREGDAELLFRHFVDHAARRQGRVAPVLDDQTLAWLIEHDWPGNVRELQHFAERFVMGLTPGSRDPDTTNDLALSERMRRFEARLISQALTQASGDVRSAIAILKMPRKTFYDKISRHGIVLEDFRV